MNGPKQYMKCRNSDGRRNSRKTHEQNLDGELNENFLILLNSIDELYNEADDKERKVGKA